MFRFKLRRSEIVVLGVTLIVAVLWTAWFLQIPDISPF